MAFIREVCSQEQETKNWFWRYNANRHNAMRRGIAFELSFEDWLSLWLNSGKYHLRGRKGAQYVLARVGDRGAYCLGNVRISTREENEAEKWARPEIKARLREHNRNASQFSLGKKWAADAPGRKVLSALRKAAPRPAGWKHTPETIEKLRSIGRTQRPRPQSEETRRKIAESIRQFVATGLTKEQRTSY